MSNQKTVILFLLIFFLMLLIFFDDPCTDWIYEDIGGVICE